LLIKVWRDEQRSIWFQGGWLGIPIWGGLVLSRQAFYAAGTGLGVHMGFGFLAMSFTAMLLARSIVVTVRATKAHTPLPADTPSPTVHVLDGHSSH
jgi:hypothetical protein